MPSASVLSGRTWEEASSPDAERLARQYESDWQAGRPLNPADYFTAPDAPPGACLAVLRADLALRFEAGESVRAEQYRDRYPRLSAEELVGLVYEEFCLFEEAGRPVEPAEYYQRFPDLADRLRRVFDIHGLVGSGRTTTFPHSFSPGGSSALSPPFPEAGQTIGGFHLVEELGRGSFARVFRAEERQLADRPVALKVSRTGSREPQMLARLQHTHIVPVYSYRTDPATGLHLLCMPYLGGVTLAQLLVDPQVKAAESGQDLLNALDRLEPSSRSRARIGSAGRTALSRRNYVRAVAWWGARLAEALEHAHERGVLHRDLKPSNVLVTGDGLPMLLDFNLAWESCIDDPTVEAATLGGTLAYMAPEHLEALAISDGAAVDERCDLYALGLVLYEAMGTRPFAPIKGAVSISEMLRRTAEQRRAGPPPLRDRHPEVSEEFAAVVHRCLAPDPAQRYRSATELATDLQAVADDLPLTYAREPMLSRAVRWTRRHRARLAVAAPILTILLGVFLLVNQASRARQQLIEDVRRFINEGMILSDKDDLHQAEARFALAIKLMSGGDVEDSERVSLGDQLRRRLAGDLDDLRATAREQARLANEKLRARQAADEFRKQAEDLRLRLLGFITTNGDPSREVAAALKPFYVLTASNWPPGDQKALLDPPRLEQLRTDVEDVLFLWTLALDRELDTTAPDSRRKELGTKAVWLCDRALSFASAPEPWRALKARIADRSEHREPPPVQAEKDRPDLVTSDRACFYWGVLREREGLRRTAIRWLERAYWLKQNEYWYHYFLALAYQQISEDPERAQEHDRGHALAHYDVAVALRADWPWPRFNRAQFYQELGEWTWALEDLQKALQLARIPDQRAPILLNLGLVQQSLGNLSAARASYDAVLEARSADDPIARAARLNRARLDVENGSIGAALEAYSALLEADPNDSAARLSRALLELRSGQASAAEADLNRLLLAHPQSADDLAYRAEARLVLGRAVEADRDAEEAQQRDPGPSRERLRLRTLLARHAVDELYLSDPSELVGLPVSGPALRADLLACVDRLASGSEQKALLNRAVLLAALGQTGEALTAADQAVHRQEDSVRPHLVRAAIRRTLGDIRGALDDVESGLKNEPEDARLLEARGRLRTEHGDPRGGLDDLEHALRHGANWTVHAARARALAALGRYDAAREAWTIAARLDPENPQTYLGRARACIQLGEIDRALADLERAASWADGRPILMTAIAVSYAQCLPARPDRLPRLIHLARRTWNAL